MSVQQSTNTETALQSRLLLLIRVSIVVLGALSAWTTRHIPNPDGVAYLDISSHYLEGHWPVAQSGYWSPAYPTLLALVRLVGGRDIANSYVVAHALNFALFLLGVASTEFLIRSVRRGLPIATPRVRDDQFIWSVLTYLLFAWTSLSWVELQPITPDLLIAVLVLLSAGLAVRIVHDPARLHLWISLGVVFGSGYLTKTAMLPVGIASLTTLTLATRRDPGSIRGVITSAAVFLAICFPQILYVSDLKGAPTIGDVARLSHAWAAARVPTPLAETIGPGILPSALPSPEGPWQDLRALDPIRDEHPMVYRVDGPMPGTFPLWYDATHWYRYVRVPLALGETIRVALVNIVQYGRWFLPFIIVGVLALAFGNAGQVTNHDFRTIAVLIIPAIFALAIYALSFIETRYVGPFAVLLIAGIVIPTTSDTVSRRVRDSFTCVALFLFAFHVAKTIALFKERGTHERRFREWVATTDSLRQLGVTSGMQVGFLGNPYTAYWAQLAGLRIVSVIPRRETSAFWSADAALQNAKLDTMKGHGSEILMAQVRAGSITPTGWIALNPDKTLLLYRSR